MARTSRRPLIRAKKQTVDGIVFDSIGESLRYAELKLLLRAGEIFDLECHVEHHLELNGRPLLIKSKGYPNGRKCKYTSDFEYTESTGRKVIEDFKGYATHVARLRIGMFELLTGKEVTIVR